MVLVYISEHGFLIKDVCDADEGFSFFLKVVELKNIFSELSILKLRSHHKFNYVPLKTSIKFLSISYGMPLILLKYGSASL